MVAQYDWREGGSMICPECGYEDEYYDDAGQHYGYEGEFFKLPVELKRNLPLYSKKYHSDLYGCPKCKKLFLGD